MNLVQKNDYGRIYVDEFTVSKIIYRYLEDNYPTLNVITISYTENVINIKLVDVLNFDIVKVEELQKEAIRLIKNKLGLYVQDLNIVVG